MKFILKKSDRRKRIQIPKSILFAGILLLLFPFCNLIYLQFYYGKSFNEVLGILDGISFVFLATSPIIGTGLLLVEKWAWWGLILFSFTLILFDASTLYANPDQIHIFSFGFTLIGFTILLFSLRKDISAPYFKLYPRGFRAERRNPVKIFVKIDTWLLPTKDVSETGVYVAWQNCNRSLGEEVMLAFEEMDGLEKRLQDILLGTNKGGIVRIDPNGVGIAFRN